MFEKGPLVGRELPLLIVTGLITSFPGEIGVLILPFPLTARCPSCVNFPRVLQPCIQKGP